MGAIPVRPLGKFVFAGQKDSMGDPQIVARIDGAIKSLLKQLYDGMFVWQNPTRHPTPGIPKAAKPYPVTITPLGVVKHRQRAALQRQRKKQSILTKKPGRRKKTTRFKIGRLTLWRSRYAWSKNRWIEDRKGWGIYKRLSDRRKRRSERQKAINERFKKFRKTRLGRIFARKRAKGVSTIKLGIKDRLAPIKREGRRRTKSRLSSKTIIVKPGRLRRAAARGLNWEGSAFGGGIVVSWGIPAIGGGRFYNYASEVENKVRPAIKGRGAAPYVRRTRAWLNEECRKMSQVIDQAFGETMGRPSGVYHGITYLDYDVVRWVSF